VQQELEFNSSVCQFCDDWMQELAEKTGGTFRKIDS
jgi:hypothetical protein